MYALIDCNNFYASCEELFNPKLKKNPLVVLSNNDGCVIARSKKSKDLKIPMGAPLFKWRDFFFRHNVATLSSNFTLYADMSARVIATLEEFALPLEVYSIDESFLKLDDPRMGAEIRQKVMQWTGIPVSIGIAKTKTLAKVANKEAKKGAGVVIIQAIDDHLKNLPVEEIWGIGGRYKEKLHSYGIRTALELKNCDDTWIRKKLTVGGLRTVWELRGISSIDWDPDPEIQKSLVYSRSFSNEITKKGDLHEAISSFAAGAAEKLRRHDLIAGHLTIFMNSNRFKEDYISASLSYTLPRATNDTMQLVKEANRMLHHLYKEGYGYKRAGVALCDISQAPLRQLDLFASYDRTLNKRSENLMKSLDEINHRYGRKTLHLAAEGLTPRWKPLSKNKSAAYTTDWDELPTIKI